jgi:hypothetical protein
MTIRSIASIFALLLLCMRAAPAAAESDSGTRRALIFCGHPGDSEHREQYAETVSKLAESLVKKLGFEDVTVLFGTEEMHSDSGPKPESAREPCTQESIGAAVAELRKSLRSDDSLWVFVVGHAHLDGGYSWFNIAGPDMHQEQFGELFRDLKCREQVFWITTAASGFYARTLAQEGRVVITATEADREINETIFPHVLASVLAEPPADLDADGDETIALLDLYIAVARRIAQQYTEENALPTEHAHLEDNGDGRGTEIQIDYLPELGGRAAKPPQGPRAGNLDGARAAKIVVPLKPGSAPAAPSEPAD